MDYRQKYLKYKQKYLDLVSFAENIRGGNVVPDGTKLIDCFIASSHNTYLEGDQGFGRSNVDCYINFIKKYGGGCVEIDILEVIEDKKTHEFDVRVSHGKSWAHNIYLDAILKGIKSVLDNGTNIMYGPIIISVDNSGKINKKGHHQQIWNMFTTILGDKFYTDFNDFKNIQIDKIKGKVLIKWKQNDECKCKNDVCPICDNSSEFMRPEIVTGEYWTHMNQSNSHSSSDLYSYPDLVNLNKIDDKKNNEILKNIIKSRIQFIRSYPSRYNVNSGNYEFMASVINGTQMVALNAQHHDKHTMFQMEFFRNGCLRKKPDWLLNITEMKNLPKKIYKITFTNLKTNSITDVHINTYDTEELPDLIYNKSIEINTIEGFELIYIKCSFGTQKYKGAITLTETQNKLYEIDNYEKNNCNWYTTENMIKKFPMTLTSIIDKQNINISIQLPPSKGFV